MSDQTVTVKYRTTKSHCACCNQKLPVEETTDREIVISKGTAESWIDWDEVDMDDMEHMVREFVYETVDFYQPILFENFTVEDSEYEKVHEFLLREFFGETVREG